MKDKKIKLFSVINSFDPKITYTVTQTKEQAREYISKKLRLDHFEHFKLWCGLRSKNPLSEDSWKDYEKIVLSSREKSNYKIMVLDCPTSRLISVLRMFCKYLPLGCSFDQDIEVKNLIGNLDEKTLKEIKENFKTIMDELEGEIPNESE